MAKSEIIAQQSAHPRGLLGHLVARVMAFDTAAVNRQMLAVLECKPDERILEVGCGHGRALRRIADRVRGGAVLGIDPSQVMCDVATRHNRKAIRAGRVRIERAVVREIPVRDAAFDKVFSVHTIYFWPDLEAGLREIHRVLRPGGELRLAFHSSENQAIANGLPKKIYTLRTDQVIATALAQSSFCNVQIAIDPNNQIRSLVASA